MHLARPTTSKRGSLAKLSAALRKLILPAEVDQTMAAVAASETIDASTIDDEIRGDDAL